MRQAVGALAVALFSMLPPATAEDLSLAGRDPLGCSAVSGDFVGFLVPGSGIVLLATREFPGGSPVGAVSDGRLDIALPGLGALNLASDTTPGTVVWGMLDRSLEIGDQRGCFAFGSFGWSSVDDLKTYLHWVVREVLANIPFDEALGEEPPLVKLAERQVTLEILTPDHRLLRLRGVEGTTFGYRPRETETTFFFQPFILGPTNERAAVRVSAKQGAFFGPGITEEIAFVLINSQEATSLSTLPPLALRLVSIEEKADNGGSP